MFTHIINDGRVMSKTICQKMSETVVAVAQLWDHLINIAVSLEMITICKDTSGKATIQLSSLLQTEFLVGVHILPCFVAHLRPLSLALPEKSLGWTSALDKVEFIMAIMAVLNEIRMIVETKFKRLFDDIAKTSDQLGCTIKAPRTWPAFSTHCQCR